MGHQPLEPPAKFRRDAQTAIHWHGFLKMGDIRLTAPTSKRRSWRVQVHYEGRRFDRSYGAGIGSAYKGYLQAQDWLAQQRAAHLHRPEFEATPLAAFIDDYITRRGKDGRWSDKTMRDRSHDLHGLRDIAVKNRLRCLDLNAAHLREHLATVGTAGRATSVKGVTKTMLAFGRQTGYFTRDQAELMDVVAWTPPKGYVRAPSRREQSRLHGDVTSGGDVMTYDQLDAWAHKCQQRWEHGYAFIHACALLGTRSGEIRVLTADPNVASAGLGNLVDLDNGVVKIRVQDARAGQGTQPPKGNKIRDIAIPRTAPAGFSLLKWLPKRIDDAMREQALGWNPRALLFPNLSGGVFGEQNLRNRVWAPAGEDLAWPMEAVGSNRRLMRFTLHSLRDRYATTALNEWNYTEEVLLQQGSWKDPETVRRHYSGITDETLNRALSIHGWSVE